MKKPTHIIEKVSLEVNTSSLETAHSIRNNIDDFLKNELFPRLETLFDEYQFQDEFIRINQLTLDLSAEKWNDFDKFKFQIDNQFREKLKSQISAIPKMPDDFEKILETDKNQSSRISETTNSGRIFLYFLENGYLPWYGKEEQIDMLIQPENWEKILKNPSFLEKLSILLKTGETSASRFVHQFPDEIIATYLNRKIPELTNELNSVVKISSKHHSDVRFILLILLIRTVNNEFAGIPESIETLIRGILKTSKTKPGQIQFPEINQLKTLFEQLLPETGIRESVLQKFKLIVSEKQREMQATTELKKTKPNVFQETKETDLRKKTKSDLTEIVETELIKKTETTDINSKSSEKQEILPFMEESAESVLVQNAGLILLHPFLKQFFATTGITDPQGKMITRNLALAVQSLHFLATGEEDAFEGSLIFEKFLCGVPLKKPIQKKSLLTDEIKTEANELLSEVIRNWTALRNTSPDGLRQMFFHRDGKLIQEDSKYRLIVERKAQDVLLEKISWNISVIKLPWISKILFTEW